VAVEVAVLELRRDQHWTSTPCGSRGLSGVRLVISDHHLRLKAAIATVMISAGCSAFGSI
jgi:transposase-like protein